MDHGNARPGNREFANFTIRDMTEWSMVLRESAKGAGSMEEAARRIVRHLYATLIDGFIGELAWALVSFFKIHSYKHLDAELRSFALNIKSRNSHMKVRYSPNPTKWRQLRPRKET